MTKDEKKLDDLEIFASIIGFYVSKKSTERSWFLDPIPQSDANLKPESVCGNVDQVLYWLQGYYAARRALGK